MFAPARARRRCFRALSQAWTRASSPACAMRGRSTAHRSATSPARVSRIARSATSRTRRACPSSSRLWRPCRVARVSSSSRPARSTRTSPIRAIHARCRAASTTVWSTVLSGSEPTEDRVMTRYARGRGCHATVAGVLAVVALLTGMLLTGHGLPFYGARTVSTGTKAAAGARGMTVLGPASADRSLAITLVLRGRSAAELDRTLAGLADPASPSYRHFLSPAEYARRFGPDPSARQRVEAALAAAGMPVTWRSPDGMLLGARATVRQAEAFFGVSIEDFRGADGRRFYAATAAPMIPPA